MYQLLFILAGIESYIPTGKIFKRRHLLPLRKINNKTKYKKYTIKNR